MDSGIVCKVWNISGDIQSKAVKDNLKDSVGYILNSEKVDASLSMTVLEQLNRECKYIENDLKTFRGALVGSHNLSSTDIKEAVEQMMETKKFYGKTDGRAALHMLISLPEEESSALNSSKLMELCQDVLKEIFPDNQAVFAVHTNTDNLHIHVIINSVGLTGKKIHQNNKFISDVLHPCINKYASIYGFKQNAKWRVESNGDLSFVEQKIKLRNAIDISVENADDFESFIDNLKHQDIQVNVGKYISLKLPGMIKAIRSHQLGNNYTLDSIVERITCRKDDFLKVEVGHYSISRPEDIIAPNWRKLKRYKELTSNEKEYVLKQLKLGKNPWRENRLKNWQQNRIANSINSKNRIDTYIKHYSFDGSIEGAMSGIIAARKKVAHEKKMVSYAKQKYKPILDIYKQMQPIMKKAFLYEYENVEEYRSEYEKYRELTRRLKDGYNKDVFEVAFFLNECDETLLYAQAELKELSQEYFELKKYSQRNHLISSNSNSLLESVGFYDDYNEAGLINLGADSFYLSSLDSDVLVRVDKAPVKDKSGEFTQKYSVTVMDRFGVTIISIDNANGFYDFESKLEKLQNDYHLGHCRKFSNIQSAREHIRKSKVFKYDNAKEINSGESSDKMYSFAQAVNHVKNASHTNVVIDSLDPNYIAVSTVNNGLLKIVILNNHNKPIDSTDIPLVEKKNNDGYEELVRIQKKYGFSDKVLEFDSVDNARKQTNYTTKTHK